MAHAEPGPALAPTLEIGPVRVYSGEKSGKYPDGNQVIVQGSHSRAAFDSPLVANRIGADYDEADLVIQGHVHEDHVTGLHRLPERTPVHVHRADLPALQSWEGLAIAYGYGGDTFDRLREDIEEQFNFTLRPDALPYDDGASWDLGGGVTVRAIHAPGHTAGHCVLLVEPVGVAFIGDIDLSGFGPYYGDRSSNLADFRETLRRLPDIPANTWITSHHRGVYTEREHFLQDLAEFVSKIDLREQLLLERLGKQPRDLEELVAMGLLYDPDSTVLWAKAAERHTIAAHLEELMAVGKLECEGGKYYRAG